MKRAKGDKRGSIPVTGAFLSIEEDTNFSLTVEDHTYHFQVDFYLKTRPKIYFQLKLSSKNVVKVGLVRDLNPGPRASEARIIPLDQRASGYASLIFPTSSNSKKQRYFSLVRFNI